MLLLKKLTLITLASGYITFYNPIGKTLSCMRYLGEPKWKWKYHGKKTGIAHRWLPCGTEVYIKVGGHGIKTKVVDRGPFGAITDEGKFVVASPRYLKNYWKKQYESKKAVLSEDEMERLSKVLPDGWQWRSVADILYSLKPKLKTKGGRQPGILSLSEDVWESVKGDQPQNDNYIIPKGTAASSSADGTSGKN
jgi:hypothetical protein